MDRLGFAASETQGVPRRTEAEAASATLPKLWLRPEHLSARGDPALPLRKVRDRERARASPVGGLLGQVCGSVHERRPARALFGTPLGPALRPGRGPTGGALLARERPCDAARTGRIPASRASTRRHMGARASITGPAVRSLLEAFGTPQQVAAALPDDLYEAVVRK